MNYNLSGLHVITDRELALPRTLPEIIHLAVCGGASVIQLRDKTASFDDIVSAGLELRELTRGHRIPLIINDHIDAALALKAEGLHVGQGDMPAFEARKIIGPDMILGVSATSAEQALKAQDEGADYIGAGPVFPTQSKSDAEPAIGLAGLRKIKQAVKIPVIAIGGISLLNAYSVADVADGIAVISAVMQARYPEEAVREFTQIINAAHQHRSRR